MHVIIRILTHNSLQIDQSKAPNGKKDHVTPDVQYAFGIKFF